MALAATACGVDVAPPTLSRVEEQFGYEPPTPPPDSETLDLDVHIDASESMRGYVVPGQSNYRRVLSSLLEANSKQYRVTRYRFPGNRALAERVGEILSPDFYGATDTPLSTVLERIVEPDRRKRISVIVSDLVMSDKSKDLSDLQSALNGVMSAGMTLIVYGFRSAFEGRYFVESAASKPLQLSRGQSVQDQGRPFYLVVVAPEANSARRLESTIVTPMKGYQKLAPTGPVLEIRSLRYTPPEGQDNWTQVNRPEALARRNGFYTILREKSDRSGPVSLRLTSEFTEYLPLNYGADWTLEATRVEWDGRASSGRSRDQNVPRVQIEPGSAQRPEAAKRIQLDWQVSPPGRDKWTLYRLVARAGPGIVQPSAWVNAWSTDDDSHVESGNRTFHLRNFAETLVSAATEKAILFEHYVVLGRS